MSYYQQQFYSPAASPSSGAPVSSFYAARQSFEQTTQLGASAPPQVGPNAHEYRQYSAPPKHPVQQARQTAIQQNQQSHSGRPGPSQPQARTQARQQFARPQSQYGQVQHTYQSPYAQVQQQQNYALPQVQPPYGTPPQFTARPQSMFGYSQFPMLPGGQPSPAQAFALYEAYNARTQRAAAAAQPQPPPPSQTQVQHQPQIQHQSQIQPQRQVQVPPYASTFGHQRQFEQYAVSPQQQAPTRNVPSNSAPSIPPASQPAFQPPQRVPTVGGRRPLPQPGQSRPRPISMPPQTQYQGSSFQVNGPGHATSASVSTIVPQSSFQPGSLPPPSLRPSSPLLMQPSSPSAASSPSVLPPSSEISSLPVQYAGNITQPGHSPSSSEPNVPPESSFGPRPAPSPSLQPSSAPPMRSCPPSISSSVPPPPSSDIQSATIIENAGSQSLEKIPAPVESTVERTPTQRRALPQSPTAPPDLSQLRRRSGGIIISSPAVRTLKSTASPSPSPQASALPPEDLKLKDEDGRSSVASQESKKTNLVTSSPQYGILDLPKRNSQVLNGKSNPSSPQYGIKDLPVRTKSVVDRRKAWERAEQGMNEATSRPHSKPVSPSKKATASMSVHKAHSPAQPVPPRSPQPQIPRQQQKLPMPVVLQPQPSRTERTPSWTLPTADLETITTASPKKTSLALRLAQMSLDEEKANSKRLSTQSTTSQAQVQRPATQNSAKTSTSRSSSPTKPYSFSTRTPRRSVNIDLNLDDAPPPSLRRSPSPSTSTASSSVPSIPSIKTPVDTLQIAVPMIPKINLPGDIDFDDIPPKPLSPQKANIPVINIPSDDDADSSGPVISVSAPSPKIRTDIVAMPVILNDLASSPSKSKPRGLPRPPSSSSTSISATSNSGSNARSRGGSLVCGGCGRGIIGRIVSAMGLRWHPQCFKCCQCGEQLEHVSSYEHDGKPYCHLDYHELYAPQCYSCKTPIIDERFITLDDPALGKRTYHEQHFFCAECGDPFLSPSTESSKRSGPNEISIKGDGAFDIAVDEDGLEVGFTVFRGHPYCEACHVRLRAPKCRGCKRSIRDGMRAVEALGGKWCYECFVCTGCQKPFEEPSFFQRGKMPFCERCFSIILRNEV